MYESVLALGGELGVPLRKNLHIEQVATGFWDVDSNTALGMTEFQDRLRYHFLQVIQMLQVPWGNMARAQIQCLQSWVRGQKGTL